MKFNRIFIALSFFLFLANCQSPSDQIKKAFEKVDKSFEQSNRVFTNSIEELYSTINTVRQQNELLALKADTIYILTNQAIIYIESLKEIMDIEDTLGTNLITAIKILTLHLPAKS